MQLMSGVGLLISLLFISVHSHPWNYAELGPDIWSDYYPLCAGQSQSPINILTACTIYQEFPPFEFIAIDNEKHSMILNNNGNTIVGIMNEEWKQTPIRLTGGGLNGKFDFVNFHLHWGENYKSGSEHRINGKKYAGEIHFVYRNHQTSQTAVLGIFMQSYLDDTPIPSDPIHDEWERYFHIAQTLKSENDSIVFDLNLTSLMGENFEEFWRYQGSLTTPPCSEGVIWTLFKQPIAFMDSQIKILRDNIYLEDYRSPQPLYNRIVYRNFLNESLTSIPDYNQCLLNSEKTKIPLPIMSIIHCSSYSVFLILLIFYSVLILIIVAFYRARHSNWKKKFE